MCIRDRHVIDCPVDTCELIANRNFTHLICKLNDFAELTHNSFNAQIILRRIQVCHTNIGKRAHTNSLMTLKVCHSALLVSFLCTLRSKLNLALVDHMLR